MEPIAQGRDAVVYALDGGERVLRRYRAPGPTGDEARLMGHLAEGGFPVPRVYETTDTDMVLERLNGPTMVEAIVRHPERAEQYGRILGELHDRLHEFAAPPWLAAVPAEGVAGNRILHLDFHPANVIVTAGGPFVIDWRNARAGDPALDLALTTVIVRYADLPEHVVSLPREPFISALHAASRTDPAPRMAMAVRARLRDPNLSAAEAERLRGLGPRPE